MLAATVDSPHPIRQARQIAEWLPVTAGATGLAILAFLPEAEQHAILARPLPTITSRTTTDRAALEQILARMRTQGYALTRGERTPGAVGVGAPIFGPAGRVIGSVGMTQPEQRFRPEDERQHAERVIAAARAITEQLSSSAPSGHRRGVTISHLTAPCQPPRYLCVRRQQKDERNARAIMEGHQG